MNAMPDAESEAFSSTQIDPDVLYAIGYNWFSQVVGHIQTMAGVKQDMTPAEILYWLGRIKYLPQGWAFTDFALDMSVALTGRLPPVARATAGSGFSLGMDGMATGENPAVPKSRARSNFALRFETSASN